MSDVKPKHSPDNPKIDPVLVYVARAIARASLWRSGDITPSQALELAHEAADRGIMSREEAITILRLCFKRARR